ncbi:MAG: TolC family protein [Limisphaerales bacterium]
MRTADKIISSVVIFIICLFAGGCTTKYYTRSADREVYRIIAQKSMMVTNMDTKFSIETNPPPDLSDCPINDRVEESLGAEADIEKGARVITLDKALELAVKHSREYQSQKEALYLRALSLSLTRHNTPPLFPRQRLRQEEIHSGVDNLVDSKRFYAGGSATLESLLFTGGKIVTDFSMNFSKFLKGDPQALLSSTMGASITQPLLRGAGYKIAVENLTQAERDFLYAVRNFTRYRKDFAIKIATAYYGVLQNRDRVRNSYRGLVNYRANVERDTAFVAEGLRAQAQLDELKQAELSTESSWINAVISYKQSLDQFKITLGLPLSTKIVLDDTELTKLQITHPQITVEDAIKIAEASRLDLHNQRDQLEDAERKLHIAKNNMLPNLDLTGSVYLPDRPGNKGLPDFNNPQWDANVSLRVPLDKKADRNTLRAAQIALTQAKRDYDLKLDNVRLEIVNDWRALDQAKRNYEISLAGVKVSERRVEEQNLRAELGRSTAREVVAAQDSLIKSRDDLTAAVIAHTLARLRFYSDMGILMINDRGKWEEMADAGVNGNNKQN